MHEIVGWRGQCKVPELWADSGWARPFHFVKIVEREQAFSPSPRRYLGDKIVSGFDYRNAIGRRSLTTASSDGVDARILNSILRCTYQILDSEPLLVVGIVTHSVTDWADAAWAVSHAPRSVRRTPPVDLDVLVPRMFQGQAWSRGPGITVVLSLSWSRLNEQTLDPDVGYAQALVSCGRAGHALLLEGQHLGLAARMTPAIHDSTAREIYSYPQGISPLYAMRLAEPAH